MEKTIKKMNFKCSCGYEAIEFELTDWDGDQYLSISGYLGGFMVKQETIWDKIRERIKFIWLAIRGKNYYAYELFLDDEEEIQRFFKEMKKFIDV